MANDNIISLLTKPFRWIRTKSQFWLLVDPDKVPASRLKQIGESAQKAGVDAILIGASLLVETTLEKAISIIKKSCNLPVIIFPGSRGQLAPNADALLFLTLLSSRNPRWLIDEQVLAAHTVKKIGIPVIPTGYLLIESGALTSVGFFSTTPPLPRNKEDIVIAHALAAQFMGMHTVFLEAGSGAKNPVPVDMIKSVASQVDIPVIVGGGLRSERDVSERAKYADIIVVGNFFETAKSLSKLSAFADAVHCAR